MPEIASLGLKADSSGVVKATEDLERLTDAAEGAQKATERLRDEKGRFVRAGNNAAGAAKKFGDDARVRRQNIRHRSGRKLAESRPHLGVGVRRRDCGVASADVRWSVV